MFYGSQRPFTGVKRPEREVEDSSPSTGKVKNALCYISIPTTYLHGVDKENFYFI
jgi:hypothetical protein